MAGFALRNRRRKDRSWSIKHNRSYRASPWSIAFRQWISEGKLDVRKAGRSQFLIQPLDVAVERIALSEFVPKEHISTVVRCVKPFQVCGPRTEGPVSIALTHQAGVMVQAGVHPAASWLHHLRSQRNRASRRKAWSAATLRPSEPLPSDAAPMAFEPQSRDFRRDSPSETGPARIGHAVASALAFSVDFVAVVPRFPSRIAAIPDCARSSCASAAARRFYGTRRGWKSFRRRILRECARNSFRTRAFVDGACSHWTSLAPVSASSCSRRASAQRFEETNHRRRPRSVREDGG